MEEEIAKMATSEDFHLSLLTLLLLHLDQEEVDLSLRLAILSHLEEILTRLFASTITSVSTLNSLPCLLLFPSMVKVSVNNNRMVSNVSFYHSE